jgi:transaldolase
MSRPTPKITAAQAESIASFARTKAQEKIAKQDFEKAIGKFNEAIVKIEERRARDKIWWERWGHWLSRVFFVLTVLLAFGATAAVIYGLLTGEIKEINRYSHAVVSIATNPSMYWAAVVYHTVLAAFVWYVSAIAWKGTRWHRK